MDDPLSVSIENTTMATTTTAATTSKTSTSSPIKILVHPFKGRCAEAARDIKRGDKVHQETAYSMVPDSEAKAQICSHCFTWLQDPKDADPGFKPIPCGGAGGADGAGCENVSYCSKACRDKDAILYHNSECSFLEKFLEEAKTTLALDSYTIDFTWMLIRAIHRSGNSDLDQLNDEESCATSYTSGSTASSFKHIWLMCSNSVCFSDEKILDFVKVSRVLVRYILHLEKEAKKSSSPPPPLLSATYSPSESESTLFTSRVAPILESNGYYTHVLTEYPFTTLSTISNLFCKAFTLICKEECNSFGIYNFSILGPTHPRQPYGLAVFPQSVFFNHCK